MATTESPSDTVDVEAAGRYRSTSLPQVSSPRRGVESFERIASTLPGSVRARSPGGARTPSLSQIPVDAGQPEASPLLQTECICDSSCASSLSATLREKCQALMSCLHSFLSKSRAKKCSCGCGRSVSRGGRHCCQPCAVSKGNVHDPECEQTTCGTSHELSMTDLDKVLPGIQWPRLLGCVAIVIVVMLLVVCLNVFQARPAPTSPDTVGTMVSGVYDSGSWLMCDGVGACDNPGYQTWGTSPKALSATVGDFSFVPGVMDMAWAVVAQHWMASPPTFHGIEIKFSDVGDFVKELLNTNPFGTNEEVPYVDLRAPTMEGKVVAITQRQLAFLVANALMGNTIPIGDGLSALLTRCSVNTGKNGYLYSLLSYLAVLSVELKGGAQGSMLIGATPKVADEQTWKQRLSSNVLAAPTICKRHGNTTDCGLPDFMTGGTPKQALTDIAGGIVGGGALLCDIANSQDESLVQFYSEVLAFAFFASPGTGVVDASSSMLPSPFTLLGARRYMGEVSGESSPADSTCGRILEKNWLNDQILGATTQVVLNKKTLVLPSSAFVAVASECSGCLAGKNCSLQDNVNNLCDAQRRHLDTDITRWYQAYEPTMYNDAVQGAFRSVVQRVGTGPWGAGVWWGDSQQYFLAVWLATGLLAQGSTKLDYYIYNHFCENPGNQCFLLGSDGCSRCISAGQSNTGVLTSRCGGKSVHDMVSKFNGQVAMRLYTALSTVGPPPSQVFDLLG